MRQRVKVTRILNPSALAQELHLLDVVQLSRPRPLRVLDASHLQSESCVGGTELESIGIRFKEICDSVVTRVQLNPLVLPS